MRGFRFSVKRTIRLPINLRRRMCIAGSCHRPSISMSLPPDFTTRLHSLTAVLGSGNVQRRYLFITMSKDPSSNGKFSASPCIKSTVSLNLSALHRDFSNIQLDMSIPVTLCPNSAKRSAKKPVPVPTSKILRFFSVPISVFSMDFQKCSAAFCDLYTFLS
ncbi:hypothetical protein C5S29_03025 [ANME-1 cluster archaeon GoMg3.2]|nr:hypothetical protein [ANME-1 cluster archaeon GoMg3.2]